MNSRSFLLVIALLSLLAVIACTSSDSPVDRRIVHRGNGGDPGTLDPAVAEDIHAFNILVDLYEGLLAEAANGDLIPGVAESWEVSDDGLIYRFRIRDEARWSNGDPVLASDFVRSFRRVASPETVSSFAFLLEPILQFQNVNNGDKPPEELGVLAVSDHQLEIQLSMPASHWLSVLALPIAFPSHVSGDANVSNGAFTLIENQIGARIRLRKNQQYWAASSVDIDEVVYFPIVDPVAEFNMYRAGELDMTNTIPSELVQTALAESRGETRIAPSLALYYLAFDMTEPPLDDRALRQALTMAVDREKLTSLIGRGEQAAFGVVPPGVAAYESAAFKWYELSKEQRENRARQLYSQAGYSTANPLTLNYIYDAGDIHERVALAITAMWRDVLGINVSLEKREWKYFLDTRDKREEWDIMRFAWFGDYNAANTFLDIFRSDNSQNLPMYQNVEFDDRLATAARQNDPKSAAAIFRDAEKKLISDYPVAPLYFYVSKHMVKPHIDGFENSVMDRHPSRYLMLTHER